LNQPSGKTYATLQPPQKKVMFPKVLHGEPLGKKISKNTLEMFKRYFDILFFTGTIYIKTSSSPPKFHPPYPPKLWESMEVSNKRRPPCWCGIPNPSFRTIKPPSLVHPETHPVTTAEVRVPLEPQNIYIYIFTIRSQPIRL